MFKGNIRLLKKYVDKKMYLKSGKRQSYCILAVKDAKMSKSESYPVCQYLKILLIYKRFLFIIKKDKIIENSW